MEAKTVESTIIDRGRGPEITGTRITVYDVMDYLKHGWHRDRIAAMFRLSSLKIAAVDLPERHVARKLYYPARPFSLRTDVDRGAAR